MGFKQERLEKIIEREIGRIIISEVKDERLKFVTITKVSLTNDYSFATIYYRVLGNENQIETTSRTLEEAKGYIKTILSKTLKIRKVPELRFKYDDSLEYGDRIEKILKDLDDH
ncbi:MAG: 30S ribosome-binding factor RbfA [Bacilli bacterium]|nr:30S ribosome-binding factor RbfA [Bacilli bacterium]MDD4076554.1 30S ribosome-binding factor RbfA [Bacilli bacterium]MDD4387738.1 30S ribosome-binding factor RbfA [Bacilli bacterium]